jgi:glycosyltransferase involved in cell wall biosynthesis
LLDVGAVAAESNGEGRLPARGHPPQPVTPVLHVLNTLQTGGAEYLVLNLARVLDRQRFPLFVCSLQGDGEIGAELRGLGVPTFALERRVGIDPRLIPSLVGLIRQHRVRIVHTHNVAPWLYAGIAARLTGAAVCHTEHSSLFPDQRALKRAEWLLGHLTKAVICDGEEVRRQLVEEQHLSPRNVVTVYNGVDTALYAQPVDRVAGRRALGLEADAQVVGTVARLEPVKDQATLLQAFARVATKLPRARLVVVGDGSLRGALEEQARRPPLAGRVLFLGRRADVASLLPLFDLFVLSSISEGLPLTILEAMAAGLPCVASAVGAVPEAIVENETGRLFPAKDSARLATALSDLLTDPTLARRLGTAGQQRARALFDLRVMTRRYEDLYAA